MSDNTDGALTPEELEDERAEALPDREALSVMGGNFVAPAGSDGGFSDMPPAGDNVDSGQEPQPYPGPTPDGIQPL